MPKKPEPDPAAAADLHEYTCIEGIYKTIAFDGEVYPVKDGRVKLTPEQAAPFLQAGLIRPAQAAPTP